LLLFVELSYMLERDLTTVILPITSFQMFKLVS